MDKNAKYFRTNEQIRSENVRIVGENVTPGIYPLYKAIKMAKDQNLSLNPVKISGLCGRLMCCLKYEYDTYVQIRIGMPNRGDKVKTPEGNALVVDTNILLEQVKVRHYLKDKPEELSEDLVVYTKDEIKVVEVNRNSVPAAPTLLTTEPVDFAELKKLED